MALSPEDSTLAGVGLAVGAVTIYDHFMPNVADQKAAPSGMPALDKGRMNATWIAAGFVVLGSFLLKSTTAFVIGGTAVVAIDFSHRYADAVHPATQQVPSATAGANASANLNVSASS